MSRTVEIRTELLKELGQGYSRPEIVKNLIDKFSITKAGAYYHFSTKQKWIADFSEAFGGDLGEAVKERFNHIYREASYRYMQARDDNGRGCFLKIMLDVNKCIAGYIPEGVNAAHEITLSLNDDYIMNKAKELEQRREDNNARNVQ